MRALFVDQDQAVEKLSRLKVGALFMDPGTGKTGAAIELIKDLPVEYILWLTPFQTKENLRDELRNWPILPIEIMGIETLSSSDRTYLDLMRKVPSQAVIVDESLKIKNWEAIRTKRIVKLGSLASYRLILNGTPLSRDLLDLWAQMEFLSPHIFNMSLREFKNTFCEYTKMIKRDGHRTYVREWINDYHNIDYLYSLMNPYIYECTLRLDIEKQNEIVNYTVTDREEYDRLKELFLSYEKLLFTNNNIFIEMTQKMQHSYCCSPEKFKLTEEIIKRHGADNVLIYCKYIASAEECRHRFAVKVLTYGKNAFGLNLQQYNVTIYFDKTFDYSVRLQADRRTWRTGQHRKCYYYDLTGDLGLERMIDRNISKKISMLNYLRKVSVQEAVKEL